jgi:uncharacterized protein involved in outer membrane biogenesis
LTSTTSAPGAPLPPAPKRRHLHIVSAIAAALVLLIVLFLLLFQWNWLRGPLARAMSARMHRPVAITGDLEVHPWSWTPQATINGLVIGAAPWAGATPLATVPKLTVRVKILPLLSGKVILPLVEVDHPTVDLLHDAQGRSNWTVTPPPKPLKLPVINHLILREGVIRYRDAPRKLTFDGVVSSNEVDVGSGRGKFALEGKGLLNRQRFVVHVTGDPLVDVSPLRPYNFDGRVEAGPTRIRVAGRVDKPFDFGALSGKLFIEGPDLADLYGLTNLALPNTPPYRLSAGFARRGPVIALSKINGLVGESDLDGSLRVETKGGRRFVKADLASRRLRLADLGAVVGGVPKHAAGHPMSPAQKIEQARLKAEHRILPDAKLDVTRVRSMDAHVEYRARSVEAGKMAIRALSLTVGLDHGVLTLNPLDITLPQGRLAGTLRLDARRDVPTEAVDLSLTNARLENLTPPAKSGGPVMEGGLYARAKLSMAGSSVRAAAGSADGHVVLAVPNGAIRETFAELMGIDVTKGLFLLLTKSQKDTPIRCGVADFHASHGVLTVDRGLLDTGVVQVDLTGDIDLRDERLDLRLHGKPKKFRLVRLHAPITVTGMLAQPKIGVDIAKAAPQALASVAVGVFAAPLAAALPFLNIGAAKNADCSALVGQAVGQGVKLKHR